MTTATAKQAQRTPGPWHIAPASCVAIGIAHQQDGEFGKAYSSAAIVAPAPMSAKGWRYVAAINGKANDEPDADAALIVRACNAHDELVAALRSTTAALDRALTCLEIDGPASAAVAVRESFKAIAEGRATLARATGE